MKEDVLYTIVRKLNEIPGIHVNILAKPGKQPEHWLTEKSSKGFRFYTTMIDSI